jgi:hypothetical protein
MRHRFTDSPPRASISGTAVLLAGLTLTWFGLGGDTSSELARSAAWGVGLSLAVSLVFDAGHGLRNLIRADVMALGALFFLTLFEFFFPQSNFNELVSPSMARQGIACTLLGIGSIAVGRHLLSLQNAPYWDVFTRPVKPSLMVGVFTLAFFFGYLHMLLAVHWNIFAVFEFWLAPRFAQPWGRGRLGDWQALIYELHLLIYLIPPLAGVVLARAQKYQPWQVVWVGLGLLVTFFFGFSSGTRNIFASYLVTFLIAFVFASDRGRIKTILTLCAISVLLLFFSTKVMLDFRGVGLRQYWQGETQTQMSEEDSLFVDYNLFVISQLSEIFPARYAHLGWEVPYLAIIRPIPRAIWKGKPEGMSLTMEEALQVEGLTLASTFIGEAYIAFGYPGIVAFGLLFGMFAGWWSHLASPRNSDFGILIYASGFFAVVISMRSLFVFTTAILPTLVTIIGGSLLIEKARRLPRKSRS